MVQLKKCETHGYYRGDNCPICGAEGKFLMNDWEVTAVSRMLAGILRHFPHKFGVLLDDRGWAYISDIVRGIKRKHKNMRWLRNHHIEGLILTDPKGRYQYDPEKGRVRATYGHSLKVDLSDLPQENIPDVLYYPATKEEAQFIVETGLKPSDRQWVHLSKGYRDAYVAGRHRVDDPVVLEIRAKEAAEAGYTIYRAAKTVYITKEIPAEFVSIAEEQEVELTEEELKQIEEERERKRKKMERRKRYGGGAT